MDIGKPKRVYRVEPVQDPVPQEELPATEPQVAPEKKEPLPAR
jgi:hypothetical protein